MVVKNTLIKEAVEANQDLQKMFRQILDGYQEG